MLRMRLDIALVERKLCESRQEAKECIDRGYVLIEGKVSTKITRKIDEHTAIVVTQRRKYVSRGGDKLEGVLHHIFGQDAIIKDFLQNKVALDVGSSTGGFSDCLLSYGVRAVTAVDVGTAQLHKRIRENSNVTIFENTDIRNFVSINTFDIIVADLSFISLDKVVDSLLVHGHVDTVFILLIKPQFEVGLGKTKKGIVKDKVLVGEILSKYKKLFVDKKLKSIEYFPCNILGGDGNQEYFMFAQ